MKFDYACDYVRKLKYKGFKIVIVREYLAEEFSAYIESKRYNFEPKCVYHNVDESQVIYDTLLYIDKKVKTLDLERVTITGKTYNEYVDIKCKYLKLKKLLGK